MFFAGYRWSERLFYEKMAAVAGAIPGSKEVIMQTLKGASAKDLAKGKEILGRYGYYGRLPGEEPGLLFFAGSLLAAGTGTAVLKQIIRMAIAARKTKTVPCRMGMEQTERMLRRRTRVIPQIMVQLRKWMQTACIHQRLSQGALWNFRMAAVQ